MELILTFFTSCWLRHKWHRKQGNPTRIRSAERSLVPGEVLFKNPDGGWLRHERFCIRCGQREYLRQLNDAGTEAKWEKV
jgi:hypothetical protein